MDELTLQEKNAMLALWKTGNGSPSQILKHHPTPKPHKNTLNSTLKNLETKGLVTYEVIGNSYNYRPLIDKEQFSETFLERFVKDFFHDSYKELALFFAAKKKLSKKEFEDLLNIIKEKKPDNQMLFLWFILKINVSLSVLTIFYLLFLRKLSFFQCNRFYFLTGVASCFFISLAGNLIGRLTIPALDHGLPGSSLSNFVPISRLETLSAVRIINVVSVVYIFGCTWMIFRLAGVLASFHRLAIRSRPAIVLRQHVFLLSESRAPFSFFKKIFVNPGLHSTEELQEILTHELSHVNEAHYLDILVAESALILCWFNPFIWTLKKCLAQNLEFAADRAVLKSSARDTRSYQLNLLRACNGFAKPDFLGYSNTHLLRNRLFMMNKERPSSPARFLAYVLILPLLALLIGAFNSYGALFDARPKPTYHYSYHQDYRLTLHKETHSNYLDSTNTKR